MARIRDADFVVRGQEGELDIGSALSRPDETAYAWCLGQVSQTHIHYTLIWKV